MELFLRRMLLVMDSEAVAGSYDIYIYNLTSVNSDYELFFFFFAGGKLVPLYRLLIGVD